MLSGPLNVMGAGQHPQASGYGTVSLCYGCDIVVVIQGGVLLVNNGMTGKHDYHGIGMIVMLWWSSKEECWSTMG